MSPLQMNAIEVLAGTYGATGRDLRLDEIHLGLGCQVMEA